jgi:ABC-type transporter Mla MlaB component
MTYSEPVKRLSLECRREIRRDDTATLIVDLAEVEKADTKLVACLVGVYRLACARAVQVEMLLPHAVEEVVTLCRLERLIERTRPQRISPVSGTPKLSPDPSTSG